MEDLPSCRWDGGYRGYGERIEQEAAGGEDDDDDDDDDHDDHDDDEHDDDEHDDDDEDNGDLAAGMEDIVDMESELSKRLQEVMTKTVRMMTISTLHISMMMMHCMMRMHNKYC